MATYELADQLGMAAAIHEAQESVKECGIPIGSALVHHGDGTAGPQVLGSGHNRRIQKSSPTLHGEMDALETAGRQKAEVYRNSTMVRLRQHCTKT